MSKKKMINGKNEFAVSIIRNICSAIVREVPILATIGVLVYSIIYVLSGG